MKNKIIGLERIKRFYLENLQEKPDISDSAVETINEFLFKTCIQLLKKANDFRKIRNPSKRLDSKDIELAIQNLNKKEE